MKAETTMELDFAAGYLIGQFEAAYEYGELSEKQHDELTQIVNYIHEGREKKRKMNKRKSGLQKTKTSVIRLFGRYRNLTKTIIHPKGVKVNDKTI